MLEKYPKPEQVKPRYTPSFVEGVFIIIVIGCIGWVLNDAIQGDRRRAANPGETIFIDGRNREVITAPNGQKYFVWQRGQLVPITGNTKAP